MDDTLTLVPNIFVNKMVDKLDWQTYQSCFSAIKNCKMKQIKWTNGTNVCGKKKGEIIFWVMIVFKDMRCN